MVKDILHKIFGREKLQENRCNYHFIPINYKELSEDSKIQLQDYGNQQIPVVCQACGEESTKEIENSILIAKWNKKSKELRV